MNHRRLTGLGAAVGAASAVTALLIGATSAAAAEARPESAFALATQGVVDLGPIVKVASPSGDRVYDELLGLGSVPGASNLGIRASVLNSEARTGYANSTVHNLTIVGLLRADIIKTTCEGGRGKLEIINGSALGTVDFPQFPITGQVIDLSPVARVTFGEERRNPDGSTTVTGIKVSVLPTAGGAAGSAGIPIVSGLLGKAAQGSADDAPGTGGGLQTITIGSATCDAAGGGATDGPSDGGDGGDGDGGDGGDHDGDGNGDGGGRHQWSDGDDASNGDDDAPSAPAPKVVSADLPVTG